MNLFCCLHLSSPPTPLLLTHGRPFAPLPLSLSGSRCRNVRALSSSEERSTFVSENLFKIPNQTVVVDRIEEREEEGELPNVDDGTEQGEQAEFLNKLNVQLDSDSTYSILLYGAGSLITLWLSFAIVGALDSIPVFPKVMEVVGLGFTVWFSYRYLIFKKNRDELILKIEDLKCQVLGD